MVLRKLVMAMVSLSKFTKTSNKGNKYEIQKIPKRHPRRNYIW